MAADIPLGFLSLLFGRHAALGGQWLSVWERQTKTSAFFRIPDQLPTAAHLAAALSPTKDVYFGVCPYRERPEGNGRGSADLAGALIGLWVDVDVYHEGAHARKDLPPSREAAFDLVYECAKPPSKVISSGYGIQAWWLFDEPYLITDDTTRAEAARMAKGWVDHVGRRAKKHGWHVDPVGELARVLRLPGTSNHKQEASRPVELLK